MGYCSRCQQRQFVYDGLGRLTSATNPESGTVTYTYDGAGNLKTRVDARNITTTYGYESLNRLTTVTYSDGVTPGVTYNYDPQITNGMGQLASVSNGNSVTAYANFDAMGNAWTSTQTTAGQTYSFAYTYNLVNAITSETYPSGRQITTSYDSANRVNGVAGTLNGVGTTYVNNFNYFPHGAPYYYTYGNTLWHAQAFNQQLQVLEAYDALNNVNDSAHMLMVMCPNWAAANTTPYLYGLCPATSGNTNNGTLRGLLFNHGTSVFAQSFSYDMLNRLTSAADSGGWSRAFQYDEWGNSRVTGNSEVPLAGNTPTSNIYSPATNQMNGQSYDAAGNQTSANGNVAAYDAENHIVTVTQLPAFGGGTETLAYDGNGQRVEKIGPDGGATVYVYDAMGQLAAEYSTDAPVTPACNTCYLSYDHLGSVRMVTDQNGNVISRHDYLPFGEEIQSGVAGRGSQFGATDYVNPRFTGQIRDSETGVDFFNARYYGSALGRFTSPDPANIGADMTDPQTWNGYSYVRNNPMIYTDPSGENLVDWFSGIWDSIYGFFGGGGGGGASCDPNVSCFSTTGYGTPLSSNSTGYSGGGLAFGFARGGLSGDGGGSASGGGPTLSSASSAQPPKTGACSNLPAGTP